MKIANKVTSIKVFGAISALLFSASIANASLIAYEDFNYAGGTSLTTTTINNGVGWEDAWQTMGSPGFVVSGLNTSLHFDQSPQLVNDGSSHIFAENSRANDRYFASTFTPAFYSTMLVTASGTGGQMRMEFYSGASMRANVGIDQGSLFVSAASTGYSPASSDSLADAFAANTTYLLAMRRGGANIQAALIEVGGDLSILNSEPTWTVVHAGTTGVAFDRLRLAAVGTGDDTWRFDELRVGTTWASVTDGLQVVPEPSSYALFAALMCLGVVVGRRRLSRG
jgi:hypothetical protein